MRTQMREQDPFRLEVVSVRLVKDAPLFSDRRISGPEDAIKAVGDFLCGMDREVMCVINLKTDNTPINCSIVSVGALNQTLAEPREIFKASILSNAAQMLLVHCHPSGCLEPSKWDVMVTDRMLKLTALMGIRLADHVIVGGDNSRYFSFQEKGMLQYPGIPLSTDYRSLEFGNAAMVAEKGKAR